MNGKDIVKGVLVNCSIIPDNYTGQVILHFGCGIIHDVECVLTKKKHLGQPLNKKILDISEIHGKKEGM